MGAVDRPRTTRHRDLMPREKEPGMAIEQAKGKLRLEEVEEAAARCGACALVRDESKDATAFCQEHLRQIYGV
jgi:hypothetical protein